MSKNLGIVVPDKGTGKVAPAKPVELWQPGPGEILFRVEAAAQNPVDQYQADFGYLVESFPLILGVDGAGVVESVGPDVSTFKPGDRIATMTPLGKASKYGVFQQHAVAKVAATIHIPSSWSFDEAATLPLAFITAAIGVHTQLGVPLPLDGGKYSPDVGTDEWFLVWGGSSSVGATAIQLAKAAGFKVVATASKANAEYVKSIGADVVLDYKDPNIVEQIHSVASLSLAYDAISQPPTQEGSINALTDGGKVAIVLPYNGTAPDGVEVLSVLASNVHNPEEASNLKGYVELWQVLIDAGKLKPHPVKVLHNGLNSIDEGFDLQRQSKISGYKVIYHPQETKE